MATSSFSPKRRRALAKTGGPDVGTVWKTPCFGGVESYTGDEDVTAGKAEKMVSTSAAEMES